MLKIQRSTPRDLFYEIVDVPRDRLLHWAHRDPQERRQRRAPVDYDLLKSGPVVEMVASDFGGRCAFCEREVRQSDGVSHFRPLHTDDHTADYADHYSWLAYEWLNLFLVCRHCSRSKAQQFPVVNRRARFLATFEEVRAAEKPYLIDPSIDNPSIHLAYLMSGECFAKTHSAKGASTIGLLDLNNPVLVDDRRSVIEEALSVWRSAVEQGSELPSDFLQSGPFRGASRSAITRTLAEYGIAHLSINRGEALAKRLRELLHRSDRDSRRALIASIELVQNADRSRRAELDRRTVVFERSYAPQPVERRLHDQLRSPRGAITSIKISNFRAVDKLAIELPSTREKRSGATGLLLLGENAVGKSTVLSAVALALIGTRQASKLRLPYAKFARSWSKERWDLWGKRPVEVFLELDAGHGAAAFLYDPVRGQIDGTTEQSTVVLGYGPHRYFAPSRGRRGAGAAEGVRSLFYPSRALPDPSEWLSDLRGGAFDEVARTMRTILPIGDDDHLVNDQRSGICILAQDQLTPVDQLSEGYRSVFAMVADICRSMLDHWSRLELASGVVLIDEIETHLHPRWKMRVISSLRRAFPQVQFITTTHDPLCVRGMDNGEVLVLTREDDGGVGLLRDLPDVSGMRAEQLLTSEYFGLSSTTDPDIHLEIAQIAKAVQDDPLRSIGAEANALISHLTVGDSATAQVIQEALLRYLRERETPRGGLSPHARADAVDAVFRALRTARAG